MRTKEKTDLTLLALALLLVGVLFLLFTLLADSHCCLCEVGHTPHHHPWRGR